MLPDIVSDWKKHKISDKRTLSRDRLAGLFLLLRILVLLRFHPGENVSMIEYANFVEVQRK